VRPMRDIDGRKSKPQKLSDSSFEVSTHTIVG
jgi:hypothetical protein